MALELQHKWEHALVAATIESAAENCPDCPLGRTAVQKLLYFLKVAGVPMAYQFNIHHYGPYNQDIQNDIEWLLADNVVEDKIQSARSSDYKPAETIEDLKAVYNAKLNEHFPVIKSVCNALSEMSPNTLELLATLDFSYRWVKASGGNGPWQERAVDKFKSIKKDKFADAEIELWYSKLVEADLITR